MSKARQDGYRALFVRMTPGACNALRKIYELARHADPAGGDPHGRHVILAMLASARHPEIARISLSNMIIRLGLKRAVLVGDTVRAAHFQAVIADFHAALDTFMGRPQAVARPGSQKKHPLLHARVLENPLLLAQLLRFKAVSGPAVARAKQATGFVA